MKETLREMIGRTVDVSFGNTAVVRGKVAAVEHDVLMLDDDEDRRIFVSIDRIAFCLEVKEHEPRAGFMNKLD